MSTIIHRQPRIGAAYRASGLLWFLKGLVHLIATVNIGHLLYVALGELLVLLDQFVIGGRLARLEVIAIRLICSQGTCESGLVVLDIG